ncbi:MAG: hypothetical protein QNJ98_08755 [Planctomycetota bacterium]|nr:hypothetical protein [Planctomycetota bacterium]
MAKRRVRRRGKRRPLREIFAERRARRKRIHPLARARASARDAHAALEEMAEAMREASDADRWDHRGLGFMAIFRGRSIDRSRSIAPRVQRLLKQLEADLRDLDNEHHDRIQAIAEKVHVESNWSLIDLVDGTAFNTTGRKLDRIRIRLNSAKVRVSSIRRDLDALHDAFLAQREGETDPPPSPSDE